MQDPPAVPPMLLVGHPLKCSLYNKLEQCILLVILAWCHRQAQKVYVGKLLRKLSNMLMMLLEALLPNQCDWH
jgi:hypothetical protein